MLRKLVRTGVALAVLGGVSTAGIHHYCPGLWVQIDRKATEWTGWTEETRKADPVSFIDHASGKLEKDLAAMRQTGRELAAEIGEISKKIREQEALRDGAMALAAEFRTQHQLCSTNATFPVTIRNAAYTEDQVKSQVSMLLAEAEGYEASLEVLTDVRDKAETELESLTVRMDKTDAQLAALAAQKPMLKSRSLSNNGEKLFAQVDSLMRENDEVLEGGPVRNVRQLLAASADHPAEEPSRDDTVEAFLAQVPPAEEEIADTVQVAATEDHADVDRDEPAEEASPSDSEESTVTDVENGIATDTAEDVAAEEEVVAVAPGPYAVADEEVAEEEGAASDANDEPAGEPEVGEFDADEPETGGEAKPEEEEDNADAVAAKPPVVTEPESVPAETTKVDSEEAEATAGPAVKPEPRQRKRNTGKVRRASHAEEDPLVTSQIRVSQF